LNMTPNAQPRPTNIAAMAQPGKVTAPPTSSGCTVVQPYVAEAMRSAINNMVALIAPLAVMVAPVVKGVVGPSVIGGVQVPGAAELRPDGAPQPA